MEYKKYLNSSDLKSLIIGKTISAVEAEPSDPENNFVLVFTDGTTLKAESYGDNMSFIELSQGNKPSYLTNILNSNGSMSKDKLIRLRCPGDFIEEAPICSDDCMGMSCKECWNQPCKEED